MYPVNVFTSDHELQKSHVPTQYSHCEYRHPSRISHLANKINARTIAHWMELFLNLTTCTVNRTKTVFDFWYSGTQTIARVRLLQVILSDSIFHSIRTVTKKIESEWKLLICITYRYCFRHHFYNYPRLFLKWFSIAFSYRCICAFGTVACLQKRAHNKFSSFAALGKWSFSKSQTVTVKLRHIRKWALCLRRIVLSTHCIKLKKISSVRMNWVEFIYW